MQKQSEVSTANIKEKLESGFFGFWVKYWKFTFLFVVLILGMGTFSLYSIPKESSPDIKLSMVAINTVYPGVNPKDIDSLITTKIEDEISDIDGIDKIKSNSYLSVSSIMVTFKNDVDMTKTLVNVKDAVDKVSLPADAKTPIVQEVNTDNTLMFNAVFYSKDKNMSLMYLKQRIRELKDSLEGKWAINKIDYDIEGKGTIAGNRGASNEYFEIQILLDKGKMQNLGITIQNVQQTIQAWNQNRPLWSYKVGDLNYDFRIDWEIKDIEKIKNIPLITAQGTMNISDIAEVKKVLTNDVVSKMGLYKEWPFDYVILGIHKENGASIFWAERKAKKELQKELQKTKYEGIEYVSVYDLWEIITDDYDQLAKNMLQTFILVFVSLLVFIGFKESIIATISLPLAFFITFIVLKRFDLTLNFLTNFSLIVTLGIAIDTTIVVIEWAHERMRQWFNPKNAILLAVRDYKMPLITGTATTVLVFIPLMMLPGTMGKFLAYIPITIFITLLAALFISLTINSALYYKLSKRSKFFESDVGDQDFMLPEIKALLEEDRKGKTEKEKEHHLSKREKIFDKISKRYSGKLSRVMKNSKTRLGAIVLPLVLLLLSVIFISPNLGFTLMPYKDHGILQASISAKPGTDQKVMESYITNLSEVLSEIPELKSYYTKIKQGTISVNIELTNYEKRMDKWQLADKEVVKVIEKKLKYLRNEGLDFTVMATEEWPLGVQEVGIKLIAESTDKVDDLISVAKDFEREMKIIPHLENITLSTKDNPGEFVYTLDKEKLKLLGMTPMQINAQIYAIMNSLGAGTMKSKYDDNDIKVLYKDYENWTEISPSTINWIELLTPSGKTNFGDIASYYLRNNLSSIDREDGKVIIKIGGDTDESVTADVMQKKVLAFAKSYQYPKWISYSAGWETEENADLLTALISSFVVALLVIFAILLLQFNSYSQPMVIMYSIAMGLLWANVGLFLFGLPYSMMFLIWYIALTGVIVNDSIVFIDRINHNIKKWMDRLHATSEAWRARLQPIILTTLTTILGLSSILPDGMWRPLAVTMMFGMMAGSLSTLFVTPALYYDIDKFKHLIRKNILAPLMVIAPVFWILAGFAIFWYFLDLTIFGSILWQISILVAVVGYFVWYFVNASSRIASEWASLIQHALGFKIQTLDNKNISKSLAMKRIGIAIFSFVFPVILWIITHIMFGWMDNILGKISGFAVVFLVYIILWCINTYFVRTGKNWQTPIDKYLQVKTVYFDEEEED